jgi:DNA-binding response OmpR family regulator
MPTPSILIVEEDGLIARFLREILSREGFTVFNPISIGKDLFLST